MNPNEPAKLNPQACAFPTGHEGDPGLTVRAYIATQVVGHLTLPHCDGSQYGNDKIGHEFLAKRAVSIADALIEELNREAK